MNMIKVLRYRFEQFLETITMLLVKRSSETGLFIDLCDYVFGVPNFGNRKSMRVIFFSKYLKFNGDFKNAARR